MARPSRAAATKAIKYADEALSDDGEDEDAELMDASELASVASSSRKGSVQKDQEDAAWSQDDDSDAKPARKKAHTSTSSSTSKTKTSTKAKAKGKGRGKAGKLSAFLAMPLDILVEISRHLDPPSLLSMSRANKMMRGVFAHRSAAPIWAIVRSNVDLPALEATDLSEMALASLVYERNCHLCGCGRATIVDYALRVRWCKKCQRANLDNQARVRRKVENLHDKAFECSPFTFHSLSGYNSNKNPYYCTPNVERINAKLHELDVKPLKKPLKKKKNKKRKRKDEDDDDTESDEDEIDNGQLEAFVQQRHDIVAASQKDAEALLEWEHSSLTARKESGESARLARKEAIKQKLLALGYSDADCTIRVYSGVWNLVDQPTQLTKSIWTRISPKIIEHVEWQKQQRLRRETVERGRARHAAVRSRYDLLLAAQQGEAFTTFPSYSIFDSLPTVEPLWVPEGATSTDEQWTAALTAILNEVELARRAIKIGYARELVKALVQAGAPVDAALVEKLEPSHATPVRPIGVLRDATKDEILFRYSDSHLDVGDTADDVSDAELDALFSRLVASFFSGDYYKKQLEPFPAVHGALRGQGRSADVSNTAVPTAMFIQQVLDIIKRAGLPDHWSSLAKLEALGPVFECHGCDPLRLNYMFFGRGPRASDGSKDLFWSEMMEHVINQHINCYFAHYALGSNKNAPEMRLSTATYPPDLPRAPTPTRKNVAPFRSIAADELEAWFAGPPCDDAPIDDGPFPFNDPSAVADDVLQAWLDEKRLDDSPSVSDDELEACFDEPPDTELSIIADDDLEAWYEATRCDESLRVADDELEACLDDAS